MVLTGFKYIDLCLDPVTGNTKPIITPSGSHVVVSLGAPFELQCRGVKAMQWQREERPKVRGEKKVDGMSMVYVPRAQPAHMGRYICLEESSQERAHIYVYVRGTGRRPGRAFSMCLSSCAVCLRGSGESARIWSESGWLFTAACVGVFAGKGVCNFARDRYT